MATLYITEFRALAQVSGGQPQIAGLPAIAEQTVAIGSEADSAALNAQTRFVRLHADAVCSILVAQSGPTATTANLRMAADQTEYFGVQPGAIISVIANT